MPYMIQGLSPPLPREPVAMNGTLYVPLKDVVETLGGSLEWEEEPKTACATIARWSALITVGETDAFVNDARVTFSAPTVVDDGSIWVPADFLHSAFGYDVELEGRNVHITNPNAEPARAGV